MGDIIRRKLARGAGLDGGPGADQGWRLAFARAARDGAGLHVGVATQRLARRSLAELLEMPPDRGMIALLDGPSGGLGLIVLSPELMSALVEMQTIGRLATQPPAVRRPTRTDAAMVSDVIDRALTELESVLADEADLEWAGGFRYASFLEDPRPLGLLLEDLPYRVLTSDLHLGDGGRTGQVLLAFPADGRGTSPAARPGGDEPAASASATAFAGALAEAALAASCVLDARIGRLTLPLHAVMALETGQVLPLVNAALDQITLAGLDGRPVATARLGQHRGLRALRLSDAVGTVAPPAAAARAAPGPIPPGQDAGFSFATIETPGLLATG
jgi:flagellar motor switch protein FliM